MMTLGTLRFPAIGKPIRKYTLPDILLLEQWKIPAGTVVGLQQTQNFGWVFVPNGTKDVRGFNLPKHLFRF